MAEGDGGEQGGLQVLQGGGGVAVGARPEVAPCHGGRAGARPSRRQDGGSPCGRNKLRPSRRSGCAGARPSRAVVLGRDKCFVLGDLLSACVLKLCYNTRHDNDSDTNKQGGLYVIPLWGNGHSFPYSKKPC